MAIIKCLECDGTGEMCLHCKEPVSSCYCEEDEQDVMPWCRVCGGDGSFDEDNPPTPYDEP
jgi:hypothetical protein